MYHPIQMKPADSENRNGKSTIKNINKKKYILYGVKNVCICLKNIVFLYSIYPKLPPAYGVDNYETISLKCFWQLNVTCAFAFNNPKLSVAATHPQKGWCRGSITVDGFYWQSSLLQLTRSNLVSWLDAMDRAHTKHFNWFLPILLYFFCCSI